MSSRRRRPPILSSWLVASVVTAVSVVSATVGVAVAPTAVAAPATPSSIGVGQALQPYGTITAASGRYHLVLQGDGNVVLYAPGHAMWATNTAGSGANLFALQPDGNLVLYAGSGTARRAVWASNTRAGAVLVLQDDGNLVLYPDARNPTGATWSTSTPNDTLAFPGVLTVGDALVSPSRQFQLALQPDGNLVLYGPSGAGWASNTRSDGTGTRLVLQGDGNLVLVDGRNAPLWSSVTWGTSPGALQVRDDGSVVLTTSSGATAWTAWSRSPGLAASVASAANIGSTAGERTAVAVLDRSSGLLYGAGDVDASYASASLVKVFIAARLLSQNAQADPATATLMYRMITLSDDNAATQLWPRAGGAGVTDWVQARYGITGLGHPTQAGWWGLTQVTANAMVRFYAAIAADPAVGPWLMNAMAGAASRAADGWNQWFGIPSATSGWRVKQGWMCCLDSRSRTHSTGFVGGDRYVVAILTDGTTSFYGNRGNDVVTVAAGYLLPGGRVPA